MTPFGAILKRCVQASPHAIGGAFADSEGEMVDSYATIDPHDWAVITAHYGVILGHLSAVFGMWHYGSPEYFIAQHQKLEVFVHTVDAGYFALLAFREPTDQIETLGRLRETAIELKKEMA